MKIALIIAFFALIVPSFGRKNRPYNYDPDFYANHYPSSAIDRKAIANDKSDGGGGGGCCGFLGIENEDLAAAALLAVTFAYVFQTLFLVSVDKGRRRRSTQNNGNYLTYLTVFCK